MLHTRAFKCVLLTFVSNTNTFPQLQQLPQPPLQLSQLLLLLLLCRVSRRPLLLMLEPRVLSGETAA